jgi:lipopolysaccharide/colanic/teichoic acid biosynthesis glycosyltransferase
LSPSGPRDDRIYAAGKAVIDFGFALFVLIFLWWLMGLVALAIRMGSNGPAVFAQDRIGRNGTVFRCYKFRTMAVGTIEAGTHEVPASSVTAIGRFLRRTKIDELPQAINILRGEMSLVGPRPCLPVQTELIAQRKARGVLDVLPGITGLSQINGIDMRDPVLLAQWDQRAIAERSLPGDLRIILSTLFGRGRGDRTKG